MLLKNFSNTKIALRFLGYFQNWRECLIGAWHLLRLACQRVPENTVLLAEPNAFHGEILPGFVKYFQDLGFSVVVLMRYANWKENPFCRFENPPECCCLTVWGMKHYLRTSKREKYKHILLTSVRAYIKEHRYYWRYPNFLGLTSEQENHLSMIEHEFSAEAYEPCVKNPELDRQCADELLHKTFVLTGFEYEGHRFPELNPCYWGNVSIKKRLHTEKRIFVTIGAISEKSRNFDKLFKAIQTLGEETPYEIQIIGSGKLENLSPKCQRHIRILGRLSFEKMFQCIEQADFFLPLLEPETQARYLHYCTSGSRQLILGFCKIPVIQETFACHYGFDESNALLYQNDFCHAIKQALKLPENQYASMVDSMQRESGRVYQQSLKNLQEKIS